MGAGAYYFIGCMLRLPSRIGTSVLSQTMCQVLSKIIVISVTIHHIRFAAFVLDPSPGNTTISSAAPVRCTK